MYYDIGKKYFNLVRHKLCGCMATSCDSNNLTFILCNVINITVIYYRNIFTQTYCVCENYEKLKTINVSMSFYFLIWIIHKYVNLANLLSYIVTSIFQRCQLMTSNDQLKLQTLTYYKRHLLHNSVFTHQMNLYFCV